MKSFQVIGIKNKTMSKQMEDYYDDFVLILAGYPQEMERFLYLNPGLRSRFAHHISFKDYTLHELMQIARQMAEEKEYELTNAAEREISNHLQKILYQKNLHFSNARYVRNIIEKSIRKQAMRLLTSDDITPVTIKQLIREDIELS